MASTFAVDLTGSSILVTGASSGLGRHFATVLARHGAKVVAAARRSEAVDSLAKDLVRDGYRCHAVTMDVRDPKSVEVGIDAAVTLAGPLTGLVNNAGITEVVSLLEQTSDSWDNIIATNLSGPRHVAVSVAGHMLKSEQAGSIVNIASITGLRSTGQISAYAAAKAGLIHLTHQMALEWARHGIRVNALAPGYIATDLNRDWFVSDAGQQLIRRIPQRRLGQPEDLDGALLLMLSDAARYMTGAVLAIDGGHLVSSL